MRKTLAQFTIKVANRNVRLRWDNDGTTADAAQVLQSFDACAKQARYVLQREVEATEADEIRPT